MVKTYRTRVKDIKRGWHLLDAQDQILGRLASKVGTLLMGRNKPYYSPHLDCGDHVVVINAKKIKVTGLKEEKKIYYRHSGYPGGLRQEKFKDLLKRKPEEVIKKAVSGMLPKNKLRKMRLKKLHIYPGGAHPYVGHMAANKPFGGKNAGGKKGK